MSDTKLPIMDEFSGVATVTQVSIMQSNGAARVVDTLWMLKYLSSDMVHKARRSRHRPFFVALCSSREIALDRT